jgi:hypothetical protein
MIRTRFNACADVPAIIGPAALVLISLRSPQDLLGKPSRA